MDDQDKLVEQDKAGSQPEEVAFHYVKSLQFRNIHVDGIFGGPSPNRQFIHAAVFAERIALPTAVYYPISDDGSVRVDSEIRREGKQGVIRELEADLILSLPAAKVFYEWLERHLKALESSHDEGESQSSEAQEAENESE